MLKMPPSVASLTWMSPASWHSCIAASACMDTPVAPIGCPLALRPPDGLTGSRPSRSVQPSLIERPTPRLRAALEQHDVALRHGQEVLHVRRGPEGYRPLHPGRDLAVGNDQRR